MSKLLCSCAGRRRRRHRRSSSASTRTPTPTPRPQRRRNFPRDDVLRVPAQWAPTKQDEKPATVVHPFPDIVSEQNTATRNDQRGSSDQIGASDHHTTESIECTVNTAAEITSRMDASSTAAASNRSSSGAVEDPCSTKEEDVWVKYDPSSVILPRRNLSGRSPATSVDQVWSKAGARRRLRGGAWSTDAINSTNDESDDIWVRAKPPPTKTGEQPEKEDSNASTTQVKQKSATLDGTTTDLSKNSQKSGTGSSFMNWFWTLFRGKRRTNQYQASADRVELQPPAETAATSSSVPSNVPLGEAALAILTGDGFRMIDDEGDDNYGDRHSEVENCAAAGDELRDSISKRLQNIDEVLRVVYERNLASVKSASLHALGRSTEVEDQDVQNWQCDADRPSSLHVVNEPKKRNVTSVTSSSASSYYSHSRSDSELTNDDEFWTLGTSPPPSRGRKKVSDASNRLMSEPVFTTTECARYKVGRFLQESNDAQWFGHSDSSVCGGQREVSVPSDDQPKDTTTADAQPSIEQRVSEIARSFSADLRSIRRDIDQCLDAVKTAVEPSEVEHDPYLTGFVEDRIDDVLITSSTSDMEADEWEGFDPVAWSREKGLGGADCGSSTSSSSWRWLANLRQGEAVEGGSRDKVWLDIKQTLQELVDSKDMELLNELKAAGCSEQTLIDQFYVFSASTDDHQPHEPETGVEVSIDHHVPPSPVEPNAEVRPKELESLGSLQQSSDTGVRIVDVQLKPSVGEVSLLPEESSRSQIGKQKQSGVGILEAEPLLEVKPNCVKTVEKESGDVPLIKEMVPSFFQTPSLCTHSETDLSTGVSRSSDLAANLKTPVTPVHTETISEGIVDTHPLNASHSGQELRTESDYVQPVSSSETIETWTRCLEQFTSNIIFDHSSDAVLNDPSELEIVIQSKPSKKSSSELQSVVHDPDMSKLKLSTEAQFPPNMDTLSFSEIPETQSLIDITSSSTEQRVVPDSTPPELLAFRSTIEPLDPSEMKSADDQIGVEKEVDILSDLDWMKTSRQIADSPTAAMVLPDIVNESEQKSGSFSEDADPRKSECLERGVEEKLRSNQSVHLPGEEDEIFASPPPDSQMTGVGATHEKQFRPKGEEKSSKEVSSSITDDHSILKNCGYLNEEDYSKEDKILLMNEMPCIKNPQDGNESQLEKTEDKYVTPETSDFWSNPWIGDDVFEIKHKVDTPSSSDKVFQSEAWIPVERRMCNNVEPVAVSLPGWTNDTTQASPSSTLHDTGVDELYHGSVTEDSYKCPAESWGHVQPEWSPWTDDALTKGMCTLTRKEYAREPSSRDTSDTLLDLSPSEAQDNNWVFQSSSDDAKKTGDVWNSFIWAGNGGDSENNQVVQSSESVTILGEAPETPVSACSDDWPQVEKSFTTSSQKDGSQNFGPLFQHTEPSQLGTDSSIGGQRLLYERRIMVDGVEIPGTAVTSIPPMISGDTSESVPPDKKFCQLKGEFTENQLEKLIAAEGIGSDVTTENLKQCLQTLKAAGTSENTTVGDSIKTPSFDGKISSLSGDTGQNLQEVIIEKIGSNKSPRQKGYSESSSESGDEIDLTGDASLRHRDFVVHPITRQLMGRSMSLSSETTSPVSKLQYSGDNLTERKSLSTAETSPMEESGSSETELIEAKSRSKSFSENFVMQSAGDGKLGTERTSVEEMVRNVVMTDYGENKQLPEAKDTASSEQTTTVPVLSDLEQYETVIVDRDPLLGKEFTIVVSGTARTKEVDRTSTSDSGNQTPLPRITVDEIDDSSSDISADDPSSDQDFVPEQFCSYGTRSPNPFLYGDDDNDADVECGYGGDSSDDWFSASRAVDGGLSLSYCPPSNGGSNPDLCSAVQPKYSPPPDESEMSYYDIESRIDRVLERIDALQDSDPSLRLPQGSSNPFLHSDILEDFPTEGLPDLGLTAEEFEQDQRFLEDTYLNSKKKIQRVYTHDNLSHKGNLDSNPFHSDGTGERGHDGRIASSGDKLREGSGAESINPFFGTHDVSVSNNRYKVKELSKFSSEETLPQSPPGGNISEASSGVAGDRSCSPDSGSSGSEQTLVHDSREILIPDAVSRTALGKDSTSKKSGLGECSDKVLSSGRVPSTVVSDLDKSSSTGKDTQESDELDGHHRDFIEENRLWLENRRPSDGNEQTSKINPEKYLQSFSDSEGSSNSNEPVSESELGEAYHGKIADKVCAASRIENSPCKEEAPNRLTGGVDSIQPISVGVDLPDMVGRHRSIEQSFLFDQPTQALDLAQNSNVQDAFVIAVEQQARERLERLSALKRIKPVDMNKLSQQLNQQSAALPPAESEQQQNQQNSQQQNQQQQQQQQLNGFIETSPIYVTSIPPPQAPVAASRQQRPPPSAQQAAPRTVVKSGGLSNGHAVSEDSGDTLELKQDLLSEDESRPAATTTTVTAIVEAPAQEQLIDSNLGYRHREQPELSSKKSSSSADDLLSAPDHVDLGVLEDSGPHREMAVDVPDSFVARSKTPPRYPPPRPRAAQAPNGSATSYSTPTSPPKPVPPPRDHLRIEQDGRLVNRAQPPQLPARSPLNNNNNNINNNNNNNNNNQEVAATTPTRQQLDSIRKYQEQLRRRREAEEQAQELGNRSLRGSRKLQALESRPQGLVNDAYSSADDENEPEQLQPALLVATVAGTSTTAPQRPAGPIHRVIGYGELVASLQRLQLLLKTVSGPSLGAQVSAVQTLLLSPQFGRALAVHNKVQQAAVRGLARPPVTESAHTLARDVLEMVRPCSLPEAAELVDLLSRYELDALLSAHDAVAATTQRRSASPPPPAPPAASVEAPGAVSHCALPGRHDGSIRIISIEKTNEPLGATVRNEGEAVIIGRIVRGGAAEKSGLLREGDEVLEVNGVEMRGKSVNEVCDILASMTGTLTFLVVGSGNRPSTPPKENTIIHMKAHFDYDPEDDLYIPCRELGISFQKGDVLHVISQDDPNWWQAYREGEEDLTLAGLIPSKSFQHQRESMKQTIAGDKLTREGKSKKASTLLCAKKNPKKKKKKPYSSTYTDGGYPLYASAVDDYESDEILTYEEVALYYPRATHRRPVVLIGPPNIGRHELRQRLMEDSERFAAAVPHTSRPRKEGEVDGQDYHFISRAQFEADILARKFVEHGEYERAYYGTSLAAIRAVVDAGRTCVLNLHPQSLRILRASDLKPYVVFVAPPSLEKLRQKKARAGEAYKEEELKDIIEKAREMEDRYGHLFDLIIINNDTDRAFQQLLSEINSLEREPQWVPAAWVKGS